MMLRWKASFSASCLHATTCLFEDMPCSNRELTSAIQPASEALAGALQACGLDAHKTLPLFTGLAADYDNNRQLVEITVARLQGAGALSAAAISRLAGHIADLEAAVLRIRPALADELAVRGRPLREQWEARGPGFLRQVALLTNDPFVAPAAEVVLVHPQVGGHGRAHLRLNRVTFEAVLANGQPEYPEALRLGWLLVQLNMDSPLYSDLIPGTRLPGIASLATVPLVLRAAEQVEWAALSETSLDEVLAHWYLPTYLPNRAARRLLDWWHAYEAGETRWPVAVAALDHMLQA